MCNKVYINADVRETAPHRGTKKHGCRPEVEQDILGIFTIYTRLVFNIISSWVQSIKSTTCYRIVTTTTQPAHLAVLLAVLFLSISLYPTQAQEHKPSAAYQFMYLAATSVHFGSQIWMTFISGLSLYFSLPRHDFGEVQKVLFPIYFTWSAGLSLLAVSAQARLGGLSITTALLAARFLLEVLVRASCCAPLVDLITRKNTIEASHGLGREVGKLAANSTLFESSKYMSLHQKFRRLHMLIAFANMASIGISTVHIWLSLQIIIDHC